MVLVTRPVRTSSLVLPPEHAGRTARQAADTRVARTAPLPFIATLIGCRAGEVEPAGARNHPDGVTVGAASLPG
ncbi:hypothetical protein GCM10023145_13200 [Angustibacter luteus]